VLALVPEDQRDSVEAAIAAAYAEHGWRKAAASVAVPSDSARRIR
jgi:DnaJ-domain-containing protein 1